jgi:hypothetical protein
LVSHDEQKKDSKWSKGSDLVITKSLPFFAHCDLTNFEHCAIVSLIENDLIYAFWGAFFCFINPKNGDIFQVSQFFSLFSTVFTFFSHLLTQVFKDSSLHCPIYVCVPCLSKSL